MKQEDRLLKPNEFKMPRVSGRSDNLMDAIDRLVRILLVAQDAKSINKQMDWLEKQLFRSHPVEGEVCHLTFDMWK